MTEDAYNPLAALRTLVSHGVEFVVIGGFAATLHGSQLFTYDLDVCYSRDHQNLERLVEALQEMKATLRGVDERVSFQLDAKTIAEGDAFTFATKAGDVDILGVPAGSDGFDSLRRTAVPMDIGDGLDVWVASIQDLIAMKRAVGRTKDQLGVEVLSALQEEIDARSR